MIPCQFCHGTGKVYAPKAKKCSVCHGTGKLDGAVSAQCTDPDRERNHALGSMAASCHTCAMQSTNGWKVGDRCYVPMDGPKYFGTIKSFDIPNGNALVTLTVNGNTGDLYVPIAMLEGTDLP